MLPLCNIVLTTYPAVPGGRDTPLKSTNTPLNTARHTSAPICRGGLLAKEANTKAWGSSGMELSKFSARLSIARLSPRGLLHLIHRSPSTIASWIVKAGKRPVRLQPMASKRFRFVLAAKGSSTSSTGPFRAQRERSRNLRAGRIAWERLVDHSKSPQSSSSEGSHRTCEPLRSRCRRVSQRPRQASESFPVTRVPASRSSSKAEHSSSSSRLPVTAVLERSNTLSS
mmetsp:Transcript_77774/g.214950  ORF Transcript_77774/g.214950 Transcript_77774/m.214950 type:complete len:227 (-) Transcript_77774:316-996(-)